MEAVIKNATTKYFKDYIFLISTLVKQKHKKSTLGNLAREKKILSKIRNFLIVLALSIHSVFEGMAIGM